MADFTGIRSRFLEISGVPFFDIAGKQCGYRGITRDITERKRAEEELKESEERYRVIADVAGKAGEAIAIVQDTEDTQGAIVFLNEEFTAMLGYSPGELLNKPFLDFISFPVAFKMTV